MLPEVRSRLAGGNGDVRSSIKRINEKIKARAKRKKQNDDNVLIFEGTDVRNALYVPYGNPGDGEMHLTVHNGKAEAKGINFVRDNVTTKFHQSIVPTGVEMDGGPSTPNLHNEMLDEMQRQNYQTGT